MSDHRAAGRPCSGPQTPRVPPLPGQREPVPVSATVRHGNRDKLRVRERKLGRLEIAFQPILEAGITQLSKAYVIRLHILPQDFST